MHVPYDVKYRTASFHHPDHDVSSPPGGAPPPSPVEDGMFHCAGTKFAGPPYDLGTWDPRCCYINPVTRIGEPAGCPDADAAAPSPAPTPGTPAPTPSPTDQPTPSPTGTPTGTPTKEPTPAPTKAAACEDDADWLAESKKKMMKKCKKKDLGNCKKKCAWVDGACVEKLKNCEDSFYNKKGKPNKEGAKLAKACKKKGTLGGTKVEASAACQKACGTDRKSVV